MYKAYEVEAKIDITFRVVVGGYNLSEAQENADELVEKIAWDAEAKIRRNHQGTWIDDNESGVINITQMSKDDYNGNT